MARVTVEDCIEKIPNRFDLVLVAARRTRLISRGSEPLVPLENDKPAVIALREIAEGLVDRTILDNEQRKQPPMSLTAGIPAPGSVPRKNMDDDDEDDFGYEAEIPQTAMQPLESAPPASEE